MNVLMRQTKLVIYVSCLLSFLHAIASAEASVHDHPPIALHDTHVGKTETRGISLTDKRRMRKLQLLEAAMEIEDEHSLRDRFDDHNWSLIKGLVATILGGAAIPTSGLLFLGWFINQDCPAFEEPDGFICNEDAGKIYGAVAKNALSRGVILLSVGLPILLSRNKIRDRRRTLKLEDKTFKSDLVNEWTVSLNMDPENQVGVITLEMAF